MLSSVLKLLNGIEFFLQYLFSDHFCLKRTRFDSFFVPLCFKFRSSFESLWRCSSSSSVLTNKNHLISNIHPVKRLCRRKFCILEVLQEEVDNDFGLKAFPVQIFFWPKRYHSNPSVLGTSSKWKVIIYLNYISSKSNLQMRVPLYLLESPT